VSPVAVGEGIIVGLVTVMIGASQNRGIEGDVFIFAVGILIGYIAVRVADVLDRKRVQRRER